MSLIHTARAHKLVAAGIAGSMIALILGVGMHLSACSIMPKRLDATQYPRTATTAISQDESTSLGVALEPAIRVNPGKSGFRFLDTGSESLEYRIALIRAAEKTIDLQYYTIHDDVSANLLLEALLQAAARGVRIRFLIDNISMGEVDHSLTILDGVKHIEIRVFNPIVTRDQPLLSRISSLFSEFEKPFKRMHNKALIVDNQLAIIGGRNLGDEYFEAHPDANFKDLDMLIAGPVTARISQSFDTYWNSEETFPIALLRTPTHSREEVDKLRQELRAEWDKQVQTKRGKQILLTNLGERLKQGEIGLLWAQAELWADLPHKVDVDAEQAVSRPLTRLEQLASEAKKEFIIVSPYFVPQDDGVAWLASLVKRGIKVRILTNSLASTDVVAVHTGYKRYREKLLEAGVELYEFQPIDDKQPRQRLFGGTAPARASLHSKLYIVDGDTILTGSFNMDPRSESLNTELAVVVHHPVIAEHARKMFEEAIVPESSYHLTLDEDGDLVWSGSEEGKAVTYSSDPQAGMRKLQSWLMGFLPVEEQL